MWHSREQMSTPAAHVTNLSLFMIVSFWLMAVLESSLPDSRRCIRNLRLIGLDSYIVAVAVGVKMTLEGSS